MSEFWKRKLAAYLHDPPSKCLDIRTHRERSEAAFRQAGFVDAEIGEYLKLADHTAAAADRLPFPHGRASGMSCAFDGVRNTFRHPLCGLPLPFHAEFKSAEQGFEGESSVQPVLSESSIQRIGDETSRWRARYFAHWRLWPDHAARRDYRLAFLPADTRIPDHSIWTHMQVVSALDGCVGQDQKLHPAFLKFQLGPVQDFIAAARSIRDLWSGSYLLSWLMAAGLKAVSEKIGPDTVIFPSLRGQPLFDLHWREDLWSKVSINNQGTVWDSLHWGDRELLTPNLPNVFLAVVPADQAAGLGKAVGDAIQAEWEAMADDVWTKCEQAGLMVDEGGFTAIERKLRFKDQVKRFLSLSWQATPWPETLDGALKLADNFDAEMPVQQARQRVQAVVDMATRHMDVGHRDGRYYLGGKNGPKEKLNNIGLGWSVILAFNSWALDAVRHTRDFSAANAGGWQIGTINNKDSLTGRDEAVAGGKVWCREAEKLGGSWKFLFKHEDWLSAPTLVKRVWHLAYLEKRWGLKTDSHSFPMPDTRGIASHTPEEDCGDDETGDYAPPSDKYFAVLALDGDEIGKWVSGEKTPPFSTQLASYKDGSNAERFGARPYFDKPDFNSFLDSRRPLSPGYHLQFSEALSNFALHCARPIVEAFDGRLIYAGGDDVLALLPADTALACASALRLAFTGREVRGADSRVLFRSPAPGFLSSEKWQDDQKRPIPFLVPGPEADASVGIAIAHFKSPLQDAVRAAQAAEKRAKKKLGRKAVGLTLMKRSGEIIEWGCQWDSGGVEAGQAILDALEEGILSQKFPHRVAELVSPYLTRDRDMPGATTAADGFNSLASDILRREVETAVLRQRDEKYSPAEAENVLNAVTHYLDLVPDAPDKIRALVGLCQTVAFASRTAVGQASGLPVGGVSDSASDSTEGRLRSSMSSGRTSAPSRPETKDCP